MNQTPARGKQCTLEEALEGISDGTHVALGGMMLYRRPMRAAEALVGMDLAGLTVTTFAAGIETDVLVSAGAVSMLRTCYAGLEYFGPAAAIRRASEKRELQMLAETELSLAAGLLAGTLEVPWLPLARGLVDTDYPRIRSDFEETTDARSGQHLLTVPAISPDVAIIHVPYADADGNAITYSAPCLDRELLAASGRNIVTAERVVETAELTSRGTVDIAGMKVDRVAWLRGQFSHWAAAASALGALP